MQCRYSVLARCPALVNTYDLLTVVTIGRPMLRTTTHIIAIVLRYAACACVLAGVVNAAQAQGIEINYDEDKQQLSLSCNNVSLNQLASRLEQQTGIQVIVYPEAEKQISANFKNLPLDRAFERIGDGSGRIFYFSKSKMKKRLVAVHFLDASNASGASSSVRYNPSPKDVEYMQQGFEQQSIAREFEDQPELMPDILRPPGLTPEYPEDLIPEHREKMPPLED